MDDLDRTELWLRHRCAWQPPDQRQNLTWYVSAPYIYGTYTAWCHAHHHLPLPRRDFRLLLESLGAHYHPLPRPRFTAIRFFPSGLASGTLIFGD